MNEQRVYLVYDDREGGKAKHVVAKNRKEAGAMAGFSYTHVDWRPWVKFVDGKFVWADSGREMEIQ